MHTNRSTARPPTGPPSVRRGAVAMRLDELARELGPAYRSAMPFPHIVLDGVFHEDALDGVPGGVARA